jgi:hypothetical protein
MKIISLRFIIPIVFLLFYGVFAFTDTAANSWNAGRVVSSSVSGQGPTTGEKNKTQTRWDIWWNYCISSEGMVYSVASRVTPAKSGLTNDNSVKFTVNRSRMYILRPSGKRTELRILRKDKGVACP